MGIMSVVGLVFDVGGRNGDTSLAFLRGLVNRAIVEEIGETLLSLSFRDSGGQRGLFGCIVRTAIW